jgi:2,4-dienoyl-CoA reductase-like NADH-dependent reductase (Old Yellow Enzyme family)
LAKVLKEHSVDLVDVSSGGNIHGAKIPVFDGYQVPFSSQVKNEAAVKTGAVGLITK